MWHQDNNRFNKNRIDVHLRRIFLPKLYFDSQKPKRFHSLKHSLIPFTAVFLGAFIVSFISTRYEAPTNLTNALAPNNYTVGLSVNSPNIDFSVDATPDGAFAIAHHDLTLTTNSSSNAAVQLEFKRNILKHTGSNNYIPLTSKGGSFSDPGPLKANQWGIAVPKGISSASAKFSEPELYQNANPEAVFAKDGIIYSGGSKTFPVYYAANIDSTKPEGEYSAEIIYTAYVFGESTQDAEVIPNKIPVGVSGIRVTIKTNIKTHRALDVSEIEPISIARVPCTNPSITKNYPEAIEISCDAPRIDTPSPIDEGAMVLVDIASKGVGKIEANMIRFGLVHYIDTTPMQSFTYENCNNMTQHQVKYLKDTRDNEVYTVAKLKDNKCWMTQNLRLKLKNSRPLTPEDSDVATIWTVPAGRDTQTTFGQRWDQDLEGYKTVRSYINPSAPNNGTYYTHSAATAQSANNIDNNGGEAPSSICPKGWRLPKTTTNATNSEFYKLARQYVGSDMVWYDGGGGYGYWGDGSHSMVASPQNYVYAGFYYHNNGSLNFVNDSGNWWSSTVISRDNAYLMYMNSSRITPRGNNNRCAGFSVRCIAKEKPAKTISQLTTMQEMQSENCEASVEHETATLRDTRDGEVYTVSKLKDGKCWMTQNLRLKLSTGKALTPADSNVSSNWTPTRSTDTASCATGVAWDQDSEGYKTVRSCYQSESTYNTNGVYYTHSAATAQSANNIDNNGGEAPSSICPKGWRLPKTTTNATSSEFYTMAQHYKGNLEWQGSHWSKSGGSHNMLASPQNFIYSGRRWYDSDGVADVGSNGYWWSSTVNSSTDAYNVYMDSSYIYPRSSYFRYYGFSVRCLSF